MTDFHSGRPRFAAERWRRLSPYLDRVLELDDDQRVTWLAALRTDDPALAADLERLVAERRLLSQMGFLDGGVSGGAPPSLAGQRIGPYTLDSPVGQGGMGTVWRARRSDGRFEELVAIKLLNLSLVGRPADQRFQREGAFLARLRHPHIAHILNAGVSELGQPYLVLEHIDGQQIDDYCDSRRLGVHARLRLFLDVLQAVAHAHAHLIVHRDIKPSNVLVTAEGHVKLLDFGIAKLLEREAEGAHASTLTREGGACLTPRYAAPEQLMGGPITTATDVFSLGVLLYELLTGRHPAGDLGQPPAQWMRAIVDGDPPRGSRAVAASPGCSAADAATIAARRASTPARLRRELRGDLDNILAKALEKTALDRYPSVSALAEDLRLFLSERPISARPDTLAYRTVKFVRRNRTTAVLTGLAAMMLAVGLAGTATQARRATRQAAIANTERQRANLEAGRASEQRDFALRQLSRAEAINDLNRFVLSDAAPSGKPFTAGDLLARAEHLLARQQDDAGDDSRVEVLMAIGRQYQVMEQHARARRLLEQAHDLAGRFPDRSLRAKAGCALAGVLALSGDGGRAEALIQEAEALLPRDPQFSPYRVFCLQRATEVAQDLGDERLGLERALETQRELRHLRFPSPRLEASVVMTLAEAYRVAERSREAAEAFARAHALIVSLGRADTDQAVTLLNNWSLALRDLGRPLEAERLLKKGLLLGSPDGTLGAASPMMLTNYARVLLDLDRGAEAATLAEQAYARARRAGNDLVVGHSLLVRLSIYCRRRALGSAVSAYAELERRVRGYSPGHSTRQALLAAAWLLAESRGDLHAARRSADRFIAVLESEPAPVALGVFLRRRAELKLKLQLPEQALADAERALGQLRGQGDGDPSSHIGLAQLTFGRTLQAERRVAEARAAFEAALGNLRPTLGEAHAETRAAHRGLRPGAQAW
jgi:eukaryotic-like serine/threonine-protein kinase